LAPHKQENFPAITYPDEFAELLLAMDCYQGKYITRAALGFTLLTCQRSQSIRFARWDQIDWNAKLWRIKVLASSLQDGGVPLAFDAFLAPSPGQRSLAVENRRPKTADTQSLPYL